MPSGTVTQSDQNTELHPILPTDGDARANRHPSFSAKHFIHDPTHLVTSSLQSIPLLNPSVGHDVANKIIYRRRERDARGHAVSIVSGGGSGHEPSFAGFVGEGLLSASVAGTIFASPGAEQIRQALTRRVDGANGVLVVVMNYTVSCVTFASAFSA